MLITLWIVYSCKKAESWISHYRYSYLSNCSFKVNRCLKGQMWEREKQKDRKRKRKNGRKRQLKWHFDILLPILLQIWTIILFINSKRLTSWKSYSAMRSVVFVTIYYLTNFLKFCFHIQMKERISETSGVTIFQIYTYGRSVKPFFKNIFSIHRFNN